MSENEAALSALRHVIDAMNSGENSAGLSAMSENVVIIDDVAPFQRAGRDEAEQWFRRLANARNRLHASLSLDVADVQVSGDRAYVVAPGHLNGRLSDADFHVDGVVTSTLTERDGSWLVDSLIWSRGR
ncbi:nuclear transport factor 2 family protein [Sphingomonas sp. NSE70-1]|uniref:Nuclear transport factor 2 family protein n=1 Tax=Sphingomonas caseinilyticus TaxID=2908205 RepID=A0ABT0RTS1_9SPHN|nr:nuclear transport factor 2 family protein [Sphingomonas caseinilyticus]MCL6698417.1 nuclear transport factor 2 family protein [Sphingomonas caseinilyticus]